MNVLQIVIALKNFRLVCKVISVLVEVVIFPTVKVHNFYKDELITVSFNFLMEGTQDLLFPNQNDKRICLSERSEISL